MLAIKLRRIGKKGQASFRLVVSEKKSKLQGKFVEDLGWINPHTDIVRVSEERVRHWVGRGAELTPSAARYLAKVKTKAEAA